MSEFSPQSSSESLPGDDIDVDYFFSLLQVDNEGDTIPLNARFRYSQNDPYAVSVLFLVDKPVEWVFGRELLLNGVYEPAGDGDVKTWPTLHGDGEAYTAFSVSSPQEDFIGVYMAPTRDMVLFLDQTLDLVPQGFESQFYEGDGITVEQFTGE
jgi:hypothetical protein